MQILRRKDFWRLELIKGFTLIEIIIAVIILGILVSLAFNGYATFVERGRTSEAVNILGSLRILQQAFYLETGYYAGVGYERDTPPQAAGIDLDTINAQAKYFDFGLIDGSYANVIGFAVRRAGGPFRGYILFMLANNEIRCGFWGPSIQEIPDCRKLGY
jgi:prepilin-type N-terminal cleavage/methylation domain-containing protein